MVIFQFAVEVQGTKGLKQQVFNMLMPSERQDV